MVVPRGCLMAQRTQRLQKLNGSKDPTAPRTERLRGRAQAIKDIFEDTRSITEPSGALAVAGAKKYLADKGLKNERVGPPPPYC
jgi:hypothetical protein